MADFQQTKATLQQARAQAQQAADELARAKARLRKIEAQEAALDRVFDANDPAHAAERSKLAQQRGQAADALKQRETNLGALRNEEKLAVAGFAVFADPRDAVTHLSDNYPFLLLPVRLETRFKTVHKSGQQPQRQLWVRVYPDTCSIDTFEADLSEADVDNARAYWIGIWQAGGFEDQERGAWRALVASHGAGRAAWIVKTYLPANAAGKPVKAAASDLILVVPAETALSDDEEKAAAAFWPALWLANGDKDAEDKARADFEAAINNPARAAEIVDNYPPANFARQPGAPKPATVSAAFIHFPKRDDAAAKRQSWSRAPKVVLLPDRFVLIAYAKGAAPLVRLGKPVPSPLAAGPDPLAGKQDQLQQKKGGIVVPDEMKWMVDFDEAVEKGMAFRIDLDATQAHDGFDRLLVLGVRLSADEKTAKAELETLIAHHQYSRSGFGLVPQGTPTNNTETGGSGFTRFDDADVSFDDLFKHKDALFTPSADWLEKQDGQWLAEYLGIGADALAKIRQAGGTDQREARAMNVALWPGTLGYWMETMLHPIFTPDAVDDTRFFFTQFVSGRGPLPAIRIGDQPYGILPATAFSRMAWMRPRAPTTDLPVAGQDKVLAHARRLYQVLKIIDADWAKMAEQVSYSGQPGDAHKILLDILGLHPASVEFSQRYAKSLEQLFNEMNLTGLALLFAAVVAAGLDEGGVDLLKQFGITRERPDILNKYFYGKHNALKGPLIDDRPLSESDPIRSYTPGNRNYVEWLIDAAKTSMEAVRRQQGFTDNKPPKALLYLMLRHALELGAYDASLRLHHEHGLISAAEMREARRDLPFIHVKPQAARSESRYHFLYKTAPAITKSQTLLIGNYIAASLGLFLATRYLADQLRALERLKDAPTARLERLLVEHLDCCTYRLDAWLLGLVHLQLTRMRNIRNGQDTKPREGIHLGAYAWLENVRPENKVLTPVALDPELDAIFNKGVAAPLQRDHTNQGYIHAPSLNQGVAAAVLRNGYLSNASATNRKTMAVNLTSERVRAALAMLEGIRGGQSLGALLGYQFERGLHDRHGLAEVDKFIYDIRRVFPLRANRLKSTRTDEGVPIEAVEARNVMDGLRFVAHVKGGGNKSYPFGKSLPPATPAEQSAINAEADRLLEIHDAVADLALAEGVYQAVLGNYDRVASTLDSYSKGHHPPEPDVVRTPSSGIGLTHRFGLQLEAGVDPAVSPAPSVPAMTPRANCEPALNSWLAAVLPSPDQIACKVSFRNAAGGTAEAEVTMAALGLQPIDLVYIVQDDVQQAMAELDDRILRHIVENNLVRPDGGVAIGYMDKIAAAFSVFEAMPLIRALRRLALLSRPLQASDLALTGEATAGQNESVFVAKPRIELARAKMAAVRADLASFAAQLDPLLADLANHRADILAQADGYVQTAAALLARAAEFGVPRSGWGFAYDWRRRQFVSVMTKVDERVVRWNDRLLRFDQIAAEYDGLPADASDEAKFDLLRRAEREVATVKINPLPGSPDAFKTQLQGARDTFAQRRQSFADILDTANTTAVALRAQVGILLPVSDIDLTPLILDEEEQQTILFAAETLSVVKAVIGDLDRRLAACKIQLDAHDLAAAPPGRVQALVAAAKALFGEHFQVVPEFGLGPEQRDELEKAFAAGTDGTLLKYLTDTELVDLPVDEWLYGVARVRDKIQSFEQVMMLSDAFGGAGALVPMQLPFRPDDRWLALKFPADYAISGERLLYTAHYAAPFQKAARQCGLLLDEWTEVIPQRDATTGITFHYDRPNSEPPQAMLLVTPTDFRGGWQWADLVDALNETLDRAKRRAVEPAHVDATAYARFLPAAITAITMSGLTISLNLAANNGFQAFVKEP